MTTPAEALRAAAESFPAGLQVVPASALDRHNLRTEWALCIVRDAPIPWELLERRYPAEAVAQARAAEGDLVVLDALPRDADLADYASVPRITERLRAPDGCPWDREQTHASLRPYLVEELYEVVDAIDDGDLARLPDELGDLLLQIALHAQIGAEEGAFDMGEVTRRLAAKLIRRHPHVFGQEEYAGADHLARWEQLKRGEVTEPGSAIAGLSRSLPALFMAERLLERAERVHARPPLDEGDGFAARLFALVAEARAAGVDAEQALRVANRRFADRFERLEALARLNGRELETLTEGELEKLWEQAR